MMLSSVALIISSQFLMKAFFIISPNKYIRIQMNQSTFTYKLIIVFE